MRDREDFRARSTLELGHVLPEVFRVLTVELGEGQRPVRHARIAAKQHIAVQVVATDGRPFEADHRREMARFVVAVRQRGVGLPRVPDGPGVLDRGFLAGKRFHDLHCGCEDAVEVTADQLRVPVPARLRR